MDGNVAMQVNLLVKPEDTWLGRSCIFFLKNWWLWQIFTDFWHARRPSAASSKEVCWSATSIRSSWRCSRRCLSVSSDSSWFLGRSTYHLKNSTETMWPGLLLGKDPRKWHCSSQIWRWMSEISRVSKPMRHVAFFFVQEAVDSLR